MLLQLFALTSKYYFVILAFLSPFLLGKLMLAKSEVDSFLAYSLAEAAMLLIMFWL